MAKKTCPSCDGKKGRHESWGTHGKGWYKCNTCGGKGFIFVDEPRPQREPKQREQREPRPQREPKQRQERPQRDSNWREKSCSAPGCYNTIHYHKDWSNIPDLCDFHRSEKKNEWQEKPCKNPRCSETVRYNINWDRPPEYCQSCSALRVRVDRQGATSQARSKDGDLLFSYGRCSMPPAEKVGAKYDQQRGWARNGYWWVAMAGTPHESFIVAEEPVVSGLMQLRGIIQSKYSTAELRNAWQSLAIAVLGLNG